MLPPVRPNGLFLILLSYAFLRMNDRFRMLFDLFILLALLAGAAPLAAQNAWPPPGAPFTADSLPRLDSLPDETVTNIAWELSARTSFWRDSLSRRSLQATAVRQDYEILLETARQDTTLGPDSIKTLQANLKLLKQIEKEVSKLLKRADQLATQAEKNLALDAASQRKKVPGLYKQVIKQEQSLLPPPPKPAEVVPEIPETTPPPADTAAVVDDDTPPAVPPVDSMRTEAVADEKIKKTTPPAARRFKAYDPAADVLRNPPAPPCSLAVNIRDEFSGEWRRELARETFFHFSRGNQRTVGNLPYGTGELSLGLSGANYLLNLHLTVRDPNARRGYGGLARNSILVLKLLDGATYTLYNIRADDGVLDAGGQYVTFRAQYLLDRGQMKKLRSTGLDKLRLAWNAGYEDYDVFNVDALQRQIQCILQQP